MEPQSLHAVREREHGEIDAGIEGVIHAAVITDENRRELSRAPGQLRRHIYAEEELLFPPLRNAGIVGPILVMLREHAQMWVALDALEQRLDAGAGDEELATACRALFIQLQEHNWKEESVLYPPADTVLDAGARSRLLAFLADGPRRTGWACQQPRV